jgi:hypothetical protein
MRCSRNALRFSRSDVIPNGFSHEESAFCQSRRISFEPAHVKGTASAVPMGCDEASVFCAEVVHDPKSRTALGMTSALGKDEEAPR